MQQVAYGEEIVFMRQFLDSNGDPYDPPDVVFRVARNATVFVTNPVSYSAGEIERIQVGNYRYRHQIHPFATPGIYSARWDVEIEGDPIVFLEEFQINEPSIEGDGLLDPPRHYGVMTESPLYNVMGVGLSDRLFLLGHASGLEINDPYQVKSMQEAVNLLGASSDSPLLRAMIEAYNAGARDIWLVAVAREAEYVPFDPASPNDRLTPRAEWGGQNFYERYYDKLQETYEVLQGYDIVEIVVPVEASAFNTGGVDFIKQLTDHCSLSYQGEIGNPDPNAYRGTGSVRLGILGTRLGNFSDQQIDEIISDPRLNEDYGDGGKFVMLAVGEGVVRLQQMPNVYSASVAATLAGVLSTLPLNQGLTYKFLPSVVTPYGSQLSKGQIKALANKKVNAITTTARGRRGVQFQTVLASDNTLATTGSDYWAITQMRVVAKVIEEIRSLGNRALGTIGFLGFKDDVMNYLRSLALNNEIKDFKLQIERDPFDMYKANAEVALTPYMGVREIAFGVQVGPGV